MDRRFDVRGTRCWIASLGAGLQKVAAALLVASFSAGLSMPGAQAADEKAEFSALAMRMLAIYLDAPEPAPGVVDEALSRRGFADIFTVVNKADAERIGKRMDAVDRAIWGKPSEDGRFDPEKPPAALIIAAYLGDWARKRYAPLVRAALDDPGFEPSNDLNIFEFPGIEGLGLHLEYRKPYDRESRRPGTWSRPSTSVTLIALSGSTTEAPKAFDQLVCTDVTNGKPFQRSGGSEMHELTKGVWRSLPFCQKDMYYATETARDSKAYVAHWRSSHSILLKDFQVILTVIKNGPLIANPQQKLFDLKNMPARVGAPNSAATDARKLLATLEVEGAHDVTGYLRGDGIPPVVSMAEDETAAIADKVARAAVAWSRANGVPLSHSGWGPVHAAKVADFIAKEEGTTYLMRSGRETAFYNRLKMILASRKQGDAPLDYAELIVIALDVAERHSGKVYIDEVYLTLHNVIRLLARPEQWIGDPLGLSADISRDLPIRLIVLDILGARSTDKQPTMAAIVEQIVPSGSLRRFPPGHAEAGRVVDAAYSFKQLFHAEHGLFRYQPNARTAHWSAGCHYYFWVGALGHRYGRAAAIAIGQWKEQRAKDAGGEHDRAIIQLSHFDAGGMTDAKINAALQ